MEELSREPARIPWLKKVEKGVIEPVWVLNARAFYSFLRMERVNRLGRY